MSTAFPKVHIVIAGIEKIIPKMSQLGLFYPLLAAHGTGQQITAYNSIFYIASAVLTKPTDLKNDCNFAG